MAISQKLSQAVFKGLTSLCLTGFCSLPVSAAERLTMQVGPLQQSVTVEELEQYAQTGKLPSRWQLFAPLLTSEMRQLLTKSWQVETMLTSKAIKEFLATTEGKQLLAQLKTAFPEMKVELLQAALILAIHREHNLSLLVLLKAYPEENLTIDLSAAVAIAVQINASNLQSQMLAPILARELEVEAAFSQPTHLEPTAPGSASIITKTLIFRDSSRRRTLLVDIYASKIARGPLAVMSHGFAADRKSLEYLAYHLASYGFSVVAIEHSGSNLRSFTQAGFNLKKLLPPSEFIDRPLDVSFVLDRLAQLNRRKGVLQGKLNTQQVTAIGHSFGGYTALALAGARLAPKELRRFCNANVILGRSPADWLQCAAIDLPSTRQQFRDRRVAQLILLNPLIGKLFGNSLSQITIPTLMVTATADGITPSLEHQIRPFAQLAGEKYLVTAIGATHMSITDRRNSRSLLVQNNLLKELIGPEANSLRLLNQALSLAFIQQLTPQKNKYQPFLTAAYAQSFSSQQIQMRFNSELPSTLDLWLSTLTWSKAHLVSRKPTTTHTWLSQINASVQQAGRAVSRPKSCTDKLNYIFTHLLDRHYLYSEIEV